MIARMLGRGSSLRANVIANYAGKVWGIASVYLFLPLYLHILGVATYGLVAFYSVALAILFVADAGLSASFAREAARGGDPARLLDLLTSIERVMFVLVGAAGTAFLLSADLIADHWLQLNDDLTAELAADSIRIMAIALVPQIAMSLYVGGLMGMQKQVQANSLSIAFNAVRSGLVLAPIYFWPDPRVFFVWHALASWIFLALIRSQLRKTLGAGAYGGEFSFAVLKPILGYAAGMFAMAFIAGINTQLDRLVVSKYLPLETFTYYTLAATLAQIPTIVTVPIALALLPKLTALREDGNHLGLLALYEKNTYIIAALGAVSAFTLFFFIEDIFAVWMPGRQMPQNLAQVTQILSAGGLFLALQLTPYHLSLANGHNKTNVYLGIVVLCLTVPLQIVLTSRHGLMGAAVPWLLLNGFALVYLGVRLNRKFYQGNLFKWATYCSALPVAVAGVFLFIARKIADQMTMGSFWACVLACTFSLLALGAAHLLWPTTQSRIKHA